MQTNWIEFVICLNRIGFTNGDWNYVETIHLQAT